MDDAFIFYSYAILTSPGYPHNGTLSLALSVLRVELPGHFCAFIKHKSLELSKRFAIGILEKFGIGKIIS